MKDFKWWLLTLAVMVVLLVVGCLPGNPIITSSTLHIVEVTANSTDNTLLNLAFWCYENNRLMLWYDFDAQPQGFNDRALIFATSAADKNVYADNKYAGNLGTDNLSTVEATITSLTGGSLNGELILLLKAKDLLETEYDLIIGESGETKVVQTNYVLVEFEKIDSTKHLYKVTKVQAGGEWTNFNVPKNIPREDLSKKGFAFFRIDGDEVVDARVIRP
ncbi:MAG: hypothetical protein ACK40Q_06965 [Pseudothermotoga sp.]